MMQAKADPNGAPEIAVIAWLPPVDITGLPGKNGTSCSATHIGPTPGRDCEGFMKV